MVILAPDSGADGSTGRRVRIVGEVFDVASVSLVRAEILAIKALYYSETTLPPRVREAVRERVTRFAAPDHAAVTEDVHVAFTEELFPRAFYENVLNFRTWPGYGDAERVAIEFTERAWLTPRELNGDDGFWDRMRANFTDSQIADLALMVTTWQKRTLYLTILAGGFIPSAHLSSRLQEAAERPIGAATLDWADALERRAANEMTRSPRNCPPA